MTTLGQRLPALGLEVADDEARLLDEVARSELAVGRRIADVDVDYPRKFVLASVTPVTINLR